MSAPKLDSPPLSERISDREFRDIQDFMMSQYGIHFSDKKQTLIVGRLQLYIEKLGFQDYTTYLRHVKQDTTGQAANELINRLTTNHTFFNREAAHFEFLMSTVIPQIVSELARGQQLDLRLWCAGCSSGEESYFLAMLLMEYFGHDYQRWTAGVLATDISTRVLEIAAKGVYSAERFQALPDFMERKYFQKLPDGQFQANTKLRREVTYRCFNLMDKQHFKKPFAVIFCRNVMIYFNRPTRLALVQRFYESTAPGGYLFIGHSETLGRGEDCPYTYVKPGVYCKRGI